MGSVQFQIAPHSSLHFSISAGPFRCSRCYLQEFSSVALVPSEAVPFVYLACLPVSSVSNFRPDTGGRRWFLAQVRVFSRVAGREGRCRQSSLACVGRTRRVPATLGLPRSRVCALPVYAAQAPGCFIWSRPCVACGSSFRVLHKSAGSVGPAFCAFPVRAAQAARSLTGVLSRVRCAFSPPRAQPQFPRAPSGAPCVCSAELVFSRDPPGGCQPSRISGSLWLETGSQFAVW